MFELTGTIKLIEDIQTFASGFSKREFVLTTDHDKYPQDIKFEVLKDKCSLLDKFEAGQPIKVSFDIRGNEYNGRYYVNLNAWRIEANQGGGAPAGNYAEPSPEELGSNNFDDPDDAIPF